MRAFISSGLVLGFILGCSSMDPPDAGDGNAGPVAGSAGTSPNTGNQPDSLEFEMASPLAAREQVVLKVRALPARNYPVSFALPSTGGDPLDAVLDRSSAMTDSNGIASVMLTAPSSPSTFDVRATILGRVATISLTVEDRGLATLQVEPSYPSALRDISTWVATAHAGKTCADVPGVPPPDGELKAPLTGKMAAPVIPRVPAGTPLAVTLRSGHFVGGCTSVEMLPPGPPSSPQVVKVTVLNRPIDLSASSLAFSLDLAAGEQTWSGTLTAAGSELVDALVGNSADDAEALLDAMRAASGDSAQAFQNARDAEGWDALVRGRWGQNSASELRDLVGNWLVAGRQSFAAAVHPFVGSLSPLLQPEGADVESGALLTMQRVAGIDAARAGFVDAARASWSASADDTLVLDTDVYFARTKLAAALAEAAALTQAAAAGKEADDAGSALALALNCKSIGSTLAAAGSDDAVAYGDCGPECLADVCVAAATALWQRGADASGVDYSRFSITATGVARVDEEAAVTGLSGTWLGQVSDANGTVATGGVITAATPVTAP